MAEDARRPGTEDPISRFVRAATHDASGSNDEGYVVAKRLLSEHPEISTEDFHVALVLGDHARVAVEIERDPGVANRKNGPRGREPLLYVTYSPFHREGKVEAEGLLEIAKTLLDAGADPNATYVAEPWDCPLGALYGACGVTNFPAMAALLLDRGAEIDDNESLYHSMEHEDTAVLDLLIERGVEPSGTNALNHSLDRAGLVRTRKILEAGADPNETFEEHGTSLHVAVSKGREKEVLDLLLAHGAELDAERPDGKTPWQVALMVGHREAADHLAGLGGSSTTSPLVDFQAACGRGDRAEAMRIAAEHRDLFANLSSMDRVTLHRLAERGRREMVDAMLAAGFPANERGASGETALHQAAWFGQAGVVEVLVARGAEIDPVEPTFGCTPLGWAAHGSANWPNPDGDYVAVVTTLAAAGADLHAPNRQGEPPIALAGSCREVADALRALGCG